MKKKKEKAIKSKSKKPKVFICGQVLEGSSPKKLSTGKIKKRTKSKDKNIFSGLLIDNPVMQSNIKCRKKRLKGKETSKMSSNSQYDWNLEEEEETNNEWIQPKNQSSVNSPSMMEVLSLSQNFTFLNLPEAPQETNLSSNTLVNNSHDFGSSFDDNNITVSVLDISPKKPYNIRSQVKDKKEQPIRSYVDENNKSGFTERELEDVDVSSNVNVSSPTHKKPFRSKSSRSSKLSCNNLQTPDNVQSENTSMHQDTCSPKRPEFYCIRNMAIVIMESESKFCFTGKLLVEVLYGAVEIYGRTLDLSSDVTKVYSPRGYSKVTIETSKAFPEGNIEDIWKALSAKGITRDSESKLQIDIDRIEPGTAVIVLQNFENNLTFFLKTYYPLQLFPNKKDYYYPWTSPRRAEIVLQADLYFSRHNDPVYKQLIVDPCITIDIAESMLNRWRANEWSCTLIAGGKNVGKSTSVRCLINSLLRTSGKVVLVDVDPGQTECTPAECISYSLIEEPLMGPNFTHLKMPIYQVFIDEINVNRCVPSYLTGIKMLVEALKACPVLSRLPVVINTMGFTQDIGWDIMIFIIKLIRPSIVLQIQSVRKKLNYIDMLSKDVVNKQNCSWMSYNIISNDLCKPCEHDFYTITSHAENRYSVARTNELRIESYQRRELVMMSYLSDIVHDINSRKCNISAGLSVSINETVPYTAPFSSLCIIPKQTFGVPASHALSVINGNIVALCGIDLTEETLQESENTSNLRVLTRRSSLCTCYGFGIVRGVDIEKQEIFISTPLSMSIIQHVNCLAGCITTPPALLQLSQGAPYVGVYAALPTSREPCRKYFRIKHQNKSNQS